MSVPVSPTPAEDCPSCGHAWNLHTDYEGGCAGGPEPCWCRWTRESYEDADTPAVSPTPEPGVCECGRTPDPGGCAGCSYNMPGHCRCCDGCENHVDTVRLPSPPVSSPTPDEQAAGEGACPVCGNPLCWLDHTAEEAPKSHWWGEYEEAVSELEGVRAQRDLLAQSMWEARRILGFDNDSDETPAATIAGSGYEGFARMHEREAAQARQDYDELCDESDGYEKATAASEAALVVVREQLTQEGARADDLQSDLNLWKDMLDRSKGYNQALRDRIAAVEALAEVTPQEAATTTRYRQLGWNECLRRVKAALAPPSPPTYTTEEPS